MAALILFAGAWLGGYVFPWWWPALAGYGVGAWLGRRASTAFLYGFLGAAAAWGADAAWQDWRNHQILAIRIAALFQLPGPLAPVAVTALIGGIMGGLGAWAGYALRAALRPLPPDPEPLPFTDAARNAAAEAAGSESSVAALPPADAGDGFQAASDAAPPPGDESAPPRDGVG